MRHTEEAFENKAFYWTVQIAAQGRADLYSLSTSETLCSFAHKIFKSHRSTGTKVELNPSNLAFWSVLPQESLSGSQAQALQLFSTNAGGCSLATEERRSSPGDSGSIGELSAW